MRIAIVVSIIVLSLGSFQEVWSEQASLYEPLIDGSKDPLIKVAKEQEEQFVRRGIRFNDPELQEIVTRVAQAVVPVVADSFINFRVYLIRDPSPIAFSLADGQIYLHTGLLARLENEAQLAAVLAHEAHHVAAHHHIQANDHRHDIGTAAGIGAVLLNRNASEGTHWGEDKYDERVVRSVFSEEMEFEADTGSVALLVRAGFQPVAAVHALARLRQDPELTAVDPDTSFNTLESMRKRQGRLQELVGSLPQAHAGATAADARPLQLRRVIEMTIDDYIRLDRPGTAVEFVDTLLAVQPDAFLYAAKGDSHLAMGPRPIHEDQMFKMKVFYKKREQMTRDEIAQKYLEMEGGPERLAYNLDSAAKAYELALQFDEENARAYRGLGNMYYEQKDYRQAGRNYVKYLKLSPDTIDRSFVLENLQHIKSELTKQKEAEK